MGFLLRNGDSGVAKTTAAKSLRIATIGNGVVKLSSERTIGEVALYTFDGRMVSGKRVGGTECTVGTEGIAGGIVRVTYADGTSESRKIQLPR